MISPDLFESREMPDDGAARQFESLVGLDRLKEAVLKEARLVFSPESLADWSVEKHGTRLPCAGRGW